MEMVILSRDFVGEKTLPAPVYEHMTFPTNFLYDAVVPILKVVGLLMLSPKVGPFKLLVP